MGPDSLLRLIIAAGGTGGHVLPAVAVLQELRYQKIPLNVLWIGGTDGIESQTAEQQGVPFSAIPTGKLRRYIDVKTARDAVNIPRGILMARRLVRAFKPDVVFSTGGFVSVPTVIASRALAPVLTHEQTTIVGLANRINMRSAEVAALSFESTVGRVRQRKCKLVVTGNPIRTILLTGDADRGRCRFNFSANLPVLFVTGGARGASPLNQRIMPILTKLLEHTQVIHQTGPMSANADYAQATSIKALLPPHLAHRYVVAEFIGDEIADVYAMADLVVSRAGAGTIAELCALGKPAILIPLPNSGGGEQVVNAKVLAERSAALLLMQETATPERLFAEISTLLANSERRACMANAARVIGRPDAAMSLTTELLALAGYASRGGASSDPR